MATFSTLGDQLIKVEVDEVKSSAFQCIICSESFLMRAERNEHLERHFVHRKCSHCDKLVIAIGDLDFELHRPVHCRTINNTCESKPSICETVSSTLNVKQSSPIQSGNGSDTSIEIIEKNDEVDAQQFYEIHVVSGFNTDPDEEEIRPTRKLRRRRTNVNYYENDQTLQTTEHTKTSSKKATSNKQPKQPKEKNEAMLIDIDFGNEENTRNYEEVEEDDEEEEEEAEEDGNGIVFDMKFDELSGGESESNDETQNEIKRQRGWTTKTKTHPKNIPCPDCKLMFRAERTLKTHRKRIHGYVQRNICSICGREFKDAGNLNQHMHTHGDSKRYICNFCGKGFHMPYNLKEHMHQHTGERPYKCSVCEKTFNRQTLRTAHMRVHTGEKPFKCSYDKCDRAYAYSTDLKRHKRSVHGEIGKTFPCPICGKVFHENKFLTKHLNVHQGKM